MTNKTPEVTCNSETTKEEKEKKGPGNHCREGDRRSAERGMNGAD